MLLRYRRKKGYIGENINISTIFIGYRRFFIFIGENRRISIIRENSITPSPYKTSHTKKNPYPIKYKEGGMSHGRKVPDRNLPA